MDIDSLNIPDEPEWFGKLQKEIGLALLMVQQAHVSLCLYYVSYRVHKGKLKKEQAKEKLDSYLSVEMGRIIGNIKDGAPLNDDLSERVSALHKDRNWLAHDISQEINPLLLALHEGKKSDINPFIRKLENIAKQACEIVFDLNVIGNELIPE